MNKKHPIDRAERLRLNREKDFLKKYSRDPAVEVKEHVDDLRREVSETKE